MLFDFLKNIIINLLFVSACSYIFFLAVPFIQKQASQFNKYVLWYLFSLLVGVFANIGLPVIMIIPILTILPLFVGIASAIAIGITTVFFHFINPLEITSLLLTLASTLPAIFLRDTLNNRNKTPYLITLACIAMLCQWLSDDLNYASSIVTGLSALLLGLSLNSIKSHWNNFFKYFKNQERYQLGIQGSNLGLWEWNIAENTLFFDTQLHDILKLPLSHLNKSPNNFTKLIHPVHHESFQKAIVLCLKGDKESFKCELQIQTPQNKWNWISIQGKVILRNSKKRATLVSGTYEDIQQKKKDQVDENTFFDPLTKLPSITLTELRFRHELTRNLRLKQIGAILYLDIDHFKEINQSYSEEFGDELLIQVGERIHRSIEKHNFCSRYKNDEFIIILNEFEKNEEDVTQQIWNEAQKILAVIQTPFQLKNYDIRIGASIGIRLFPANYLSESEYFRNAKQAMQQSKEKGKNTISFFNDEVQQRVIKRHSLHRDFQKALSAKEFSLHFQPLVNSKKVIVGAEALSRWNHKSLGVIPPIEFLPFLKDMQNIQSHTRWIIQEVCRFYKNSAINQLPEKFQRISINLNENQFYWPELQQCFIQECNRYAISPTAIELEITEATIEKFPKRSLEICQSLKSSGFYLCIDDFGSNHSNIAFLQKFPISRLKIDIKLISNLHRKNTGIDAIVKSLIAIAIHLGVEVLAEGVELESHYSELKKSPCKLYQGFYFSRPLPEKVFSEILTMEVL